MSRAGSLPIQTPAPPGAWLNTPALATTSARRKSLLKVRFDVDPGELSSDMSIVESTPPRGKVKVVPPKMPKDVGVKESRSAEGEGEGQTTPDSGVDVKAEEVQKEQVTPERPMKRESPSKSPSVRLLDAFGREAKEDLPARSSSSPSPPPVKQADKPSYASKQSVRTPDTSQNKSSIRIVDAMGRVVDEEGKPEVKEQKRSQWLSVAVRGRRDVVVQAEDDDDVFEPLSHNEALARVRKTIADLAIDLDEVDRYVHTSHLLFP